MRLYYQGNFNPELLYEELLVANIVPAENLHMESKPDNSAVYLTLPDEVDKTAVEAVIKAHDPNKLSSVQRTNAVAQKAKTDAQAVLQWANWTEAEAGDFIEQNAQDMGSTKPILKDMARMLIALRNRAWPDLQK